MFAYSTKPGQDQNSMGREGDACILCMNALLLDFCQLIVYATRGSNDQLFGSYQVVLLFAT